MLNTCIANLHTQYKRKIIYIETEYPTFLEYCRILNHFPESIANA